MSGEKFGALGGPSIRTLLLEEALHCSKRSDDASTTDAYDTAKMYDAMCVEALRQASEKYGKRTDLTDRLIAQHDKAVEAGRK